MTEHRIAHRPAGESIHLTVDGHGPAILLLAGTGQDSSDWHRAGYVAGLCGSYQVVAVDLPGQGRSHGATDAVDYYLAPMLAILEDVASDLALSEFALLGYSSGGALALQADAHLRRVTLVVAIGTISARRCPGLLYLRMTRLLRRTCWRPWATLPAAHPGAGCGHMSNPGSTTSRCLSSPSAR